MFMPSANIKVYLAMGFTDMRKSINGLKMQDLKPEESLESG